MKIARASIVTAAGLAAVLGMIGLLRPVEAGPVREMRLAAAGDHLILSEVFYDASGADNNLEWVELYNPTTGTIDLGGYSLGNGGSDYTYSKVQLSGAMPGGACWVVGGPTSSITN